MCRIYTARSKYWLLSDVLDKHILLYKDFIEFQYCELVNKTELNLKEQILKMQEEIDQLECQLKELAKQNLILGKKYNQSSAETASGFAAGKTVKVENKDDKMLELLKGNVEFKKPEQQQDITIKTKIVDKRDKEFNREVSEITKSGWKNDPIKFFPNLLLTPVLPPIEESTCAKSVVGIFINFNPLL